MQYSEADLRRAAAAGIRAPSMHNTQPWYFRLRRGAIEVLADPTRQLAVADRAGWAVRLACGAAVYNARLALAVGGTPAEIELIPDRANPNLIARLAPGPDRPTTGAESDLYAAIFHRHSNRAPFWPISVPAATRRRLIEAARAEGAWLELLVGTAALCGFADVAEVADRVLLRNARYQYEMASWTHADVAPDGVPVTAGAPAAESQDLLPQRFFSDRRRSLGDDYEPEPLVGILGVAGDRRIDQIVAGQVLQKVLLTAADAGLAVSMLSQPIEVPAARDQIRRSLGRVGVPQLALRLGYGAPGRPTPRRDVADVLLPSDD